MAEDIKQEMNSTPGCIPTKWTRTTVADGDWLQENTIKPLSSRDNFLADKLSAASVDLDALSAAIDTVSSISDSKDTFLSGSIDYVSATLDSFSAKVETSAENLYNSITAERNERLRGDEDLQGKINVLEAANDVIMVYGTHAEFVAGSASLHLTDKDVIKVLFDDTVSSNQVYYEYTLSTNSWDKIGELDPYYSKAEIESFSANLSSTIANTYLSANGTDISAGKNLDVVIQSNNPRVAFKTKDNVTFDGVSSTTLSATTAYGSSAKFENISATSLIALTATGNSAKFTNLSSTNLTSNNISSTKTTATTAYITNLNGDSKSDTVDNLFGSAYSGAYASAWINDNESKIAYTADFKGTNGVVTGYGTSAFAGGISSISAKAGNSTALFTGYNVNLQAGAGVGFNYGTNLLTISAEGKTYANGNYIQISGDNNSINVTTPLVNSASSGYSAYDWITTKSATLSAGFGIQFTSAATTAMGIKLDATINADDKIASIGGKELVGGNDVKIVGLISGVSIDPYEYSGNITSISAFHTSGPQQSDKQGIVYKFKDENGDDQSFYSIFVPSADSLGVQYLATSGYGEHRDYYWEDITLPSNYVKSSPANLTIVVGSTGTDLNTLYIY